MREVVVICINAQRTRFAHSCDRRALYSRAAHSPMFWRFAPTRTRNFKTGNLPSGWDTVRAALGRTANSEREVCGMSTAQVIHGAMTQRPPVFAKERKTSLADRGIAEQSQSTRTAMRDYWLKHSALGQCADDDHSGKISAARSPDYIARKFPMKLCLMKAALETVTSNRTFRSDAKFFSRSHMLLSNLANNLTRVKGMPDVIVSRRTRHETRQFLSVIRIEIQMVNCGGWTKSNASG